MCHKKRKKIKLTNAQKADHLREIADDPSWDPSTRLRILSCVDSDYRQLIKKVQYSNHSISNPVYSDQHIHYLLADNNDTLINKPPKGDTIHQLWADYNRRLEMDHALSEMEVLLERDDLSSGDLMRVENLIVQIGDAGVICEKGEGLLVRFFEQCSSLSEFKKPYFLFPALPTAERIHSYLYYMLESNYVSRHNYIAHLFTLSKDFPFYLHEDSISDDELNLVVHHLFRYPRAIFDLLALIENGSVYINAFLDLRKLVEQRHKKDGLMTLYLHYLLGRERLEFADKLIDSIYINGIKRSNYHVTSSQDYYSLKLPKNKKDFFDYNMKKLAKLDQEFLFRMTG